MTREESMLRQVAANIGNITFEDLTHVSEELPSEVVRQIAGVADRAAALECWRSMMHAAVDAVAEHYKTLV
jgi:hypothetical protein